MRKSLIIILVLIGCTKMPETNKDTIIINSPFKGDKPEKEYIDFNLTGTWIVFRYDLLDNQSKLELWKMEWNLGPKEELSGNRMVGKWRETNGHGIFRLTYAPQILYWEHDGEPKYFSINHHHFGLLDMTAEDNEHYLAIRK